MSKPKVIWLQSISCNGNSHSFLNHSELFGILAHFELLYHPLLETPYGLEVLFEKSLACDILILEGSFRKEGFKKLGEEVFNVAYHYATLAKHIVTVGSCASFGGVFQAYDPEAITGFCFNGEQPTPLYEQFSSKLITLSGCPIHPKWLSFVLMSLAKSLPLPLDSLHRPEELYASTVHSGCSRNEYFEWKVDAKQFGQKEGCLFYEQGCQAPFTAGSCNKILWNESSSKTRVGTPCFGCTSPSFPKKGLFTTPKNMGIPASMPTGVPRRAYLTATGIAKSFTIPRLEGRLFTYEMAQKD